MQGATAALNQKFQMRNLFQICDPCPWSCSYEQPLGRAGNDRRGPDGDVGADVGREHPRRIEDLGREWSAGDASSRPGAVRRAGPLLREYPTGHGDREQDEEARRPTPATRRGADACDGTSPEPPLPRPRGPDAGWNGPLHPSGELHNHT